MAGTCDTDERWLHSKRPFIWQTGDREKTNRTTPKLCFKDVCKRDLQELGINTDSWEVTATDRNAWRHTVKLGLSQYEETQRVKVEEKSLRKKTACLASRPTPSHVPSVIETATPELIFTATTDAAKWVQIYGLLRPTDVNE